MKHYVESPIPLEQACQTKKTVWATHWDSEAKNLSAGRSLVIYNIYFMDSNTFLYHFLCKYL